MNSEMDGFLSVGLERFRKGTAVMISFEKEIEARLQKILSGRRREEWGSFVPDAKAKVKSSYIWKQYPHLSAFIKGELGGAEVTMTIAINWYQSETNYPYYEIYLQLPKGDAEKEPNSTPLKSLKEFPRAGKVHYFHAWIDALRLDPDEDDFNLERDFSILLDQLVGFFGE